MSLSKHFIPIKRVKDDSIVHKSPYQLLQEMQQENNELANDGDRCLEIIKNDTFAINDSLIQKSKSVRRRLLDDWNKLNEAERTQLRAQRSKMGVSCSVCGLVGYYREMCTNNCPSPPATPDSDESPPSSARGKKKVSAAAVEAAFVIAYANSYCIARRRRGRARFSVERDKHRRRSRGEGECS